MPEDISRHSSLDNYWCYMFERLVSFHKQQANNRKNICKTLADRVHQLHFVEMCLETSKCSCLESIDQKQSKDFSYLTNAAIARPLVATSNEVAVDMLHYVYNNIDDIPSYIVDQIKFGILLGAGTSMLLTQQQRDDVSLWVKRIAKKVFYIPEKALEFKRLLKEDQYNLAVVFHKDDVVTVKHHNDSGKEWVATVESIFRVGPVGDQFYSFIHCKFYVPSSVGQDIDVWTGEPKLYYRNYARELVQPTSYIKRKVMLWDCEGRGKLCIDPNPPIDGERIVSVPPCPSIGDYIKFNETDGSIGMLNVSGVNEKVVVYV